MSNRAGVIQQSTPRRVGNSLRNSNQDVDRNTVNGLGMFGALSPVGQTIPSIEEKKISVIQGDFSQRKSGIFSNEKQLTTLVPPNSLPPDTLAKDISLIKHSIQARMELLEKNIQNQPGYLSMHNSNEFVGMQSVKRGEDQLSLNENIWEATRIPFDYQFFSMTNSTKGAKLYSARHVRSARTVCFKISHGCNGVNGGEPMLVECKVLASVRHPNIVKYMDSWMESKSLVILEEYCFGRSLYQYFNPNRPEIDLSGNHDTCYYSQPDMSNGGRKIVHPSVLTRLFVDIVKALYYLNDNRGILHGDVKPSNILIQIPDVVQQSYTTNDKVYISELVKKYYESLDLGNHSHVVFKLTDFGNSKIIAIENKKNIIDFDLGDARYACKPCERMSEVWLRGVDIYALAISIYHAAGGDMNQEVLEDIQNGIIKSYFDCIPDNLLPIIKRMVNPDEDQRPFASVLMEYCSKLSI